PGPNASARSDLLRRRQRQRQENPRTSVLVTGKIRRMSIGCRTGLSRWMISSFDEHDGSWSARVSRALLGVSPSGVPGETPGTACETQALHGNQSQPGMIFGTTQPIVVGFQSQNGIFLRGITGRLVQMK